ncbi:MAG TPA: hypothetical protein VFH95_16180 [Candidatus Kapabacteria bacterium]|nr:hypothetical protein [Candidatus Kapabacteria bacterium]
MNYNRKVSRIISAFAVLMLLAVSFTASQAAVDYFLKIKGIGGAASGYEKIIQCASGQHLKVAGLKPGTYSVQLVDRSGNKLAGYRPGNNKTTRIKITREWSNDDKMAIKGQGAPSGEALAGRRQHQPILIWKEIDSATPVMFTIPPSSSGNEHATEEVELVFDMYEKG